jgi:RNA polymerase sigma factor (sigma-70 family)
METTTVLVRPEKTKPTPPTHVDLDGLVRRAAEGDAESWRQITERFTRLLWSVARSHRLNDMDAADVVQNTWLRLLENLSKIEQPQALPKWLATTARREALSVIRRRQRDVLTRDDDDTWEVVDDRLPEIDAPFLDVERDRHLWDCFRQLPERDQVLLRVLMASDTPHYADVAAALDMPVGSIGPTRMRALARLRQIVEASAYPFNPAAADTGPGPHPR